MLHKSIIQRIINWNIKRNLLNRFPTDCYDSNTAALNIAEELVEFHYNISSDEARSIAADMLDWMHKNLRDKEPTSPEQKIDALCDMNVYSIGEMAKMHYNPQQCMEQTLAEIESREGEIVEGKFVKDTSEKAKDRWYFANYSACKVGRWNVMPTKLFDKSMRGK